KPFLGSQPADVFSITFTSGTTGLPKAVVHRAENLLLNAVAFNEEQGFDESHRFLHLFPMSYMAGFLNTLLCPLMCGASVVRVPPPDGAGLLRFWDPVMRYGANTFWLTPSIAAALVRVDRSSAGIDYCRRSVKTICVGTAPLPLSVARHFQ